ncbi:hypothetical protein D4764_01G0008140, partial [Takifugu flavidus]
PDPHAHGLMMHHHDLTCRDGVGQVMISISSNHAQNKGQRLQEFSRARWLVADPIGIAAGIQSAAELPSKWRFLGNLEQEAAGVLLLS